MIDPEKSTVQNEGPEMIELNEKKSYPFEIVDFFLVEDVPGYQGGPAKDHIYFYVSLLAGDNRGFVMLHDTTVSFTAGFEGGSPSNLYKLACAVVGEILDDEEPFDVNALAEGKFKGKVKKKESGYYKIVGVQPLSGEVEGLSAEEAGEAHEKIEEIHGKVVAKVRRGQSNEEDLSDEELADIDKKIG